MKALQIALLSLAALCVRTPVVNAQQSSKAIPFAGTVQTVAQGYVGAVRNILRNTSGMALSLTEAVPARLARSVRTQQAQPAVAVVLVQIAVTTTATPTAGHARADLSAFSGEFKQALPGMTGTTDKGSLTGDCPPAYIFQSCTPEGCRSFSPPIQGLQCRHRRMCVWRWR